MKKLSKILALVLVLMMVLATVSVFNFTASAAGDVTVSVTMSSKGWTNESKHTSLDIDSNVKITLTGGSNTGKYYTNGNNWRLYQTENPSMKVEAVDGVTIKTVKFTYNSEKTGVLTLNGSKITSGTTVNVNATSVTFGVGNTGTATNGQVRITQIQVVYSVASTSECEHKPSGEGVVTDPTCTNKGYTTYTCSECAEPFTVDGDPATGIHIDENGDFTCDYNCGEVMLPEADSILTIEEALKLGALYTKDNYTSNKYYVTGVITSIENATYGNVKIEDENGKQILLYGLYSEDGNVRYDAMAKKPVPGDTITVYGIVGYYSAPQMKNVWMTEHIPAECEHVDADGDYMCDNNCGVVVPPEADSVLTFEQATTLGELTTTTDKYYLTGTVTSITNTEYGNLYIKDAEGNEFYIYGLYNFDGSIRFDSMQNKPLVGDEITVWGIITSFNGTAQMKNGWIDEIVHTHTYDYACDTDCNTCGETRTVSHNMVAGTVVAPTFESEGYTVYTCDYGCGTTENRDTVPALVAVAQIGEQKYASLQEALNVGGEVVLLTDIGLTDNKGLSVPAGVEVVLDLNGHVLGSNAAEAATSAVIVNRGTLTIKDSVGGGKITTAAVNPDLQTIPGYASNTVTNYGVLVLESGTIENTTNAGAAYAVDNSSNGVNATFTMNGGKLVATRCALRMFCNSAVNENNVTINGGEIVGGTRAIWIHLPGSDSTKAANGNLTINGGTLNGGSGQSLYVYTYGNNHTGTFVTITGGTFLNDVLFGGADSSKFDYATKETVSITGGTFNGWLGRYLANGGWENLTGDEGYHLVEGVVGAHEYSEETDRCECGELNPEHVHNYENSPKCECGELNKSYYNILQLGENKVTVGGNAVDNTLGYLTEYVLFTVVPGEEDFYTFAGEGVTVLVHSLTDNSNLCGYDGKLDLEAGTYIIYFAANEKYTLGYYTITVTKGAVEEPEETEDPTLSLGENTVVIDGTITNLAQNAVVWYTFTPSESGVYNFVCSDLTVYILTSKSIADTNAYIGNGLANLEANVTYYVLMGKDGVMGTFTVNVSKAGDDVEVPVKNTMVVGDNHYVITDALLATGFEFLTIEITEPGTYVITGGAPMKVYFFTVLAQDVVETSPFGWNVDGGSTTGFADSFVVTLSEVGTYMMGFNYEFVTDEREFDINIALKAETPDEPTEDEPTEPQQPTEEPEQPEEELGFFAQIWAKILAVLQVVLGFFKGLFVKG